MPKVKKKNAAVSQEALHKIVKMYSQDQWLVSIWRNLSAEGVRLGFINPSDLNEFEVLPKDRVGKMDAELKAAYRRLPSARAPLVHPTWERDGQWRIVLEIPLEVRKETNLPRRWKLRTPFKEDSPEPSAHNIKIEETSVHRNPGDGLPSDYESDFDASMESASDTEDDVDEEDVIEVDEYFDAEDDVDAPESAEVIVITDSEASDDSDDCFVVVDSELLPCDASETLTSGL